MPAALKNAKNCGKEKAVKRDSQHLWVRPRRRGLLHFSISVAWYVELWNHLLECKISVRVLMCVSVYKEIKQQQVQIRVTGLAIMYFMVSLVICTLLCSFLWQSCLAQSCHQPISVATLHDGQIIAANLNCHKAFLNYTYWNLIEKV